MDFYIIWFVLLQVLCGKLVLEKKCRGYCQKSYNLCNREKAGKTAPAQGLYLEKVAYYRVKQPLQVFY